jgi:protein-tyrosine phosphatase
MSTDRVIKMAGCLNFRDLGGVYLNNKSQVRKGILFRSDGLSRLTDNDLKVFESLEINSVIDLRHAEEIDKAPDKLPQKMSVKQVTCGFYAEGTKELFQSVNSGLTNACESQILMRNVYAKMPIRHTVEIRKTISHLLHSSNLPCLIHCMSGKDRTGLVIAIILKAIGAPMSIVLQDYEMSNGDYQQVDVFGPKALRESISAVMAADATYLEASFNSINEIYATFENYLTNGLMLRPVEIEKLKSLLTT